MSHSPRALFVTDLDGTLLGPDKEIPRRNLEAIRMATACGVVVAVVTGRRRSTVAREYVKLDGLDYRVATSSGAVILGGDNWTPEVVHGFPWALADEVAASDALRGARVLCMVVPAVHDEHDCYVIDVATGSFGSSATPYRAESVVAADAAHARQMTLVHIAVHWDDRSRADDFVAALSRRLPAAASAHVSTSPVGFGALAEIVPRGGKGLALAHFASAHGVSPDRTAAIGDDLNDIDLLAAATHRFAVGGSRLSRARPDAIEVGPASDGAVADALERFVAAMQER